MSEFEQCERCPGKTSTGVMDTETFFHTTALVTTSISDRSHERKNEIMDASAEGFRKTHSTNQQMAANACAQVISAGDCPKWCFDPKRSGVFARNLNTK